MCSECYQCVEACLADALAHEEKPEELNLEVGSVVLCAGSEPYDPSNLESFYHYSSNPDVMTSLEFERMLSASGPTMGHLQRPSDGKEPKKIAWLQCIGSRDNNRCGNGYCSSVCCMYAIKDAMIAKDHSDEDLDCAIFNMDIRTFGKDYEKYYIRAKEQAGVRFVKSRVHTIDEMGDNRDLRIRYADESGEMQEEFFDIIVLSVGLQVPEKTRQMAERLGVSVDKYNFAEKRPLAPVETSRPGVFAAACSRDPRTFPVRSPKRARQPALLAEGSRNPATPGPGRWNCPPRSTWPERSRESGCLSATAASTSQAPWTSPPLRNSPGPCPAWSMRGRTCSRAARMPRS